MTVIDSFRPRNSTVTVNITYNHQAVAPYGYTIYDNDEIIDQEKDGYFRRESATHDATIFAIVWLDNDSEHMNGVVGRDSI